MITLPHKTKPFLCPVNPICDIYEIATDKRIPDELLFYSHPGFTYIRDESAAVPARTVFTLGSIGEGLYSSLARVTGFKYTFKEDEEFETALKKVKTFIDKNIPVILFGVDMYHLSYHKRYYRSIHVFGHIVLMCGYDENGVYLYDNSKPERVYLSNDDLQRAWGDEFFGLCKKNAYFAIEAEKLNDDTKQVVSQLFTNIAEEYFTPKDKNTGRQRLKAFSEDMLRFSSEYDAATLTEIYTRIARFTGSVIPALPDALSNSFENTKNAHMGSRDLTSAAIRKYKEMFPAESYPSFERAAGCFEKSGKEIQRLTDMLCDDVLSQDFSNAAKYTPVLKNILRHDSDAFSFILEG